MITFESLVNDFKTLNIHEGDIIFLRVSYRSIGGIEGGPKVFIDALLSVIGITGTIVVTAYPKRISSRLRFFQKKKIVSDISHLPSNTGIISSICCKYPGAMFTQHPTYPCVIIGKNANIIARQHSFDSYPFSIMENLANNYNAKCLRVGGDILVGTTHVALHEALMYNNCYQRLEKKGLYVKFNRNIFWRADTTSAFCVAGYKNFFYKYIYKEAVLAEGFIGNGDAMITSMKRSLELERKYLFDDIKNILCDDPNCNICRATYSFSNAKMYFFVSQIWKLFTQRDKKFMKNIYMMIRISLLGSKVQ